jgi:hypothetical protein
MGSPRIEGRVPVAVALALVTVGALAAIPLAGRLVVLLIPAAALALLSPVWLLPVYALALAVAEPAITELSTATTAMVKAAIIALALVAIARRGLRPMTLPILAFFGTWVVAMAWSALSPDPYELGLAGMAVSWAGYLTGWVHLLPRYRAAEHERLLRVLVYTPTAAIVAGLALWPLTGRSPLASDTTGFLRLQGPSIPPHLAMITLVALAASIVVLHRTGRLSGYLWGIANAGILAATLTRGAMLACGVLLLFALLLRRGGPVRPAVRYAMMAALAVVVVPIGLIALQRNQGNEYEGAVNTSGRVQAWDFYLSVAERHPFTGNGIGAAAVANIEERPVGVQATFAAPHNEYIHMYVDTGWLVGAAILLVTGVLLYSVRHSEGRMTALGLLGAFAVLAVVDNPLSTPVAPLGLAVLLNALLPSGGDGRSDDGPVVRPTWLPRRGRQRA